MDNFPFCKDIMITKENDFLSDQSCSDNQNNAFLFNTHTISITLEPFKGPIKWSQALQPDVINPVMPLLEGTVQSKYIMFPPKSD